VTGRLPSAGGGAVVSRRAVRCVASSVAVVAVVMGSVTKVAANPTLAFVPESLEYKVKEGQGNPVPKTVMMVNLGDGELSKLAPPKVTYGAGSGWLTAVAGGEGNRQSVRNTVDVTGLGPNTYTSSVEVVSEGASGSPKSYAVSLTIAAEPDSSGGPVIVLQPRSIELRATAGKAPSAALVDVTQQGDGELGELSTAVRYAGGDGWLTVTLTEDGQGRRTLRNVASIAGLRPGTYAATVEVNATQASNSPQSYGVSLTVVPSVDDGGVPIDEPAPTLDAGTGANLAGRDDLVGGCGCRTGGPMQVGGWVLLWMLLGLFLTTRGTRRRR